MSSSATIFIVCIILGLVISIARKHLTSILVSLGYLASATILVSDTPKDLRLAAMILVVFLPFLLAVRTVRIPEANSRMQFYAIGLFLSYGLSGFFWFNHWPFATLLMLLSIWTLPFLLFPPHFKQIIKSPQIGVLIFLQVEVVFRIADYWIK